MMFLSKKYNELRDKLLKFKNENERALSSTHYRIKKLEDTVSKYEKTVKDYKKNKVEYENVISNLTNVYNDVFGTIHWLSDKYADYHFLLDKQDIVKKKRNGKEAICTEKQKEFAKANRELRRRNRELELIIKKIETENPYYEEIVDESTEDSILNNENSSNNDRIKLFTNENEDIDKSEVQQRALERYINRRKSKNAIGKEYERYIGYLFEQRGYKVAFHGIKKRYEDLGIDLICVKQNQIILVQCKYWSSQKEIRENAINQFFGTSMKYYMDYKKGNLDLFDFGIPFDENFKPIFITTTNLSDTAKEFADVLRIKIDTIPFDNDYPRVKCNINSKGEKIFHLPFDQQYDNIQICQKGEFYAYTVKEAEEKGFRRAMRYFGNK